MYIIETFKKIWTYTGRKVLVINLLLLVFAAIFEQIYLVFFSELINRIIGFDVSFSVISFILLFIIVNSLLKFFIKISLNICRIDFIKNIKQKFFSSVFISTENMNDSLTDITTRNSENINNLNYLYDSVYSNVFRCFTRIVAAFIIIVRINLLIAFLSILVPVLYNIIFILNGKNLNRMQCAEWRRNNRSNEFFDEINKTLIGVQGLKAQKKIIERTNYLLQNSLNMRKIISKFWARVSAGDSLLTQAFPIFLICIMIIFSHNYNNGEIGSIYTILYNIPIFLSFVWDFDINAFNRFNFSLSKIEEYIIPFSKTQTIKEIKTFKKLEFNNVCVVKNDKYIIENLNFTIRRNEKVLICGPSGSGKTTVINIILGIVRDFEGKVFLNDKKLEEIDICNLYNLLSYSSENNYFFTGTMSKNLKLINDSININEILKNELIKNTLFRNKINESFSAGEKGFVSFLNTINSKKNLLIFDETCANLDKKNLQKVITDLEKIQNKTIIFVCHNPTIIENNKIFTKIINLGGLNE